MTLRRATRAAATGVGTTSDGDDLIHLTTNPMAVAVDDMIAIARAIIIIAAMEVEGTRRSTATVVVAGVMTPTKKMMGVSTNVGNATTAVATTTMAMVLSRRRMAKTVTTRPCQRAIRRDSRTLPNSAWRRPKYGP